MSKTLKHLVGIAAISCLMSGVEVHAANGINATADLSNAQEVTAAAVTGLIESASITAKFERDLSAVDVKFKINGGGNVVAAHFHCAPAGSNGPVVVTLFSRGLGPLIFDGEKASGTLTNVDVGDCNVAGQQVNNIASLAMAMRAGLIYINVHTIDNPGGEVRGQMLE